MNKFIMVFQSISRRLHYELLPNQDHLGHKKRRVFWIFIILFSLCASIGSLGFLSGRHSVLQENKDFPEINYLPSNFKYNRTFAEAPSGITNELWDSLFPKKGGFFGHPMLGDERFDFAVFHQLHCLNGFRMAYWNLRNQASPAEGAAHYEDAHIRHCIDFLRQSLMCLSDTTVEVVEMVENGEIGVRGFGTQHNCRDFHQLRDWTSQWEDFGIVSGSN